MSYIHAITLMSIAEMDPIQVQLVAPHLLKAATLSCRRYTYLRFEKDTFQITVSGNGSDELSNGTHDIRRGPVTSPGQNLDDPESCPLVNGRPVCG